MKKITKNVELFVVYSYKQLQDSINEPASIVPIILKTAESREDKSTDIDLIFCRLRNQLPEYIESACNDMSKLLEQTKFDNIIQNEKLYSTFKHKRCLSQKQIYQNYWDKVMDNLSAMDTNAPDFERTLCELSFRYCITNKGTANSHFRCPRFESLLRELILIDVKYGTSAWLAKHISCFSTFIIGYADHVYNTLPEYFIKKIEQMAPQFSITDVMEISLGIVNCHRNEIPKQ